VTSISSLHPSLLALEDRIFPLRRQLTSHPLYASIHSLDHLRIFMESHVFAVWDFMCLLKSLQRSLTSIATLWFPSRYPASRRFINEIVLGEESDEYEGRSLSHFEIYLEAMQRIGADTSAILNLIDSVKAGFESDKPFENSLRMAPVAAGRFVQETLHQVRSGTLAAQAASFTFGREDAIPDIFRALVRDLDLQSGGDLRQFVWYLERHIEVDGEDHGPLSLRMVTDLCGDDPDLWEDAAQAAENALRSRLALWDGILKQIQSVS
jgi:hypothetical protein